MNDVGVTTASARIPVDGVFDILFGRVGIAVKEGFQGHDHSWCAITALQGIILDKSLLKWMKFPLLCQPLDREDLFAGCLNGQHRACIHRISIENDCATSTLTPVTPNLRSDQTQIFPQKLSQCHPNIDVEFNVSTVDCEYDPCFTGYRHFIHSPMPDGAPRASPWSPA
jgi:hypothetical protein